MCTPRRRREQNTQRARIDATCARADRPTDAAGARASLRTRKDQAVRVWEQLDENGNGKVSYPEFKAFAQDRLADVAVDDINYTTRSHVDVGSIQAKAAIKP